MENRGIAFSLLKDPLNFCALGFGSGLSPRAPGTAGTVVGVMMYLGLQHLPFPVYLAVVVVVVLAGIWICGHAARALGVHDHPAIVWDEIAGILITLTHIPDGWYWLLAGFLLFRGFDIVKPWPIRQVDKGLGGGLGIMLDDILAGLFSLICLQLIYYLL
jgi:phosphatidylglycerophosphatase A